jgi:hypothetical protein
LYFILIERLNNDSEILKKLLTEQENYFKQSESIDSVEQAEYALETHAHHVTELTQLQESRFKEIKKVAEELYKEKFEHSSQVKDTESSLARKFEEISKQADEKKKVLHKELEHQKKINDEICQEFANAVKNFTDWLQKKKYVLSSNNKDSELEQQLVELESSTKDHSEANKKLDLIKAADEKVKKRQITNNPHTNVALGDVLSQWSQYLGKNDDVIMTNYKYQC